MPDELETVLRLVAEGRLSPEEAAPIIEALGAAPSEPRRAASSPASRVRIQVSERGRRVVDLRVPLAFAAVAARSVPGIPESYAGMIERAVASGTSGTILDAEDESGDGVLITVE